MKKEKKLTREKSHKKIDRAGKLGLVIIMDVILLFMLVCSLVSYARDFTSATQTAKTAM